MLESGASEESAGMIFERLPAPSGRLGWPGRGLRGICRGVGDALLDVSNLIPELR